MNTGRESPFPHSKVLASYRLVRSKTPQNSYTRKEKLGLTQEAFAELLKVEPRTVQRWEKGDRKPRQEYMVRMQQIDERSFYQGTTITVNGSIFTAETHSYKEVRKIVEDHLR